MKVVHLPIIALLTLATTVQAADDPARERLTVALRHYMAGDPEAARTALAEIINDASITDPQVRLQARSYLGEVLFVQNQREAAWDVFRSIVEERPDHRLDPYEHPPDVVDFYETVRAAISAQPTLLPTTDIQPPALDDRSFPIGGLLPFGVYQLSNEQPIRGSLLALGQAATGAASVGLLASLVSDHSAGSDLQEEARLQRARGIQWGCTFAFYGLWFTGVVDATVQWRRKRETSVHLQAGPGQVGVAVTFP